AAAYPLVPMADFPIFRAVCRRLLDLTSFASVDRTFAAAIAETLNWLGSQRDTREHFHSLELELDELDAKIPRTQHVLDCQVRVHNALQWLSIGDAGSPAGSPSCLLPLRPAARGTRHTPGAARCHRI